MKHVIIIISMLFFNRLDAQVGIGISTPDQSTILHIESTNKGVLIPKINLISRTHQLDPNFNNANSLLVFNIGTNLKGGFYYWKAKLDNGIDNGEWVTLGSDAIPASSFSNFFYMPSILLPTNRTNTSYVTYDSANNNYVVDLYSIFKSQFNNPIKGSGNLASLSDLVFSRNAYEYYIIYADNSIFPHTDIKFSTIAGEEGKFTYKVDPSLVIKNGAFMNIVLKVK